MRTSLQLYELGVIVSSRLLRARVTKGKGEQDGKRVTRRTSHENDTIVPLVATRDVTTKEDVEDGFEAWEGG